MNTAPIESENWSPIKSDAPVNIHDMVFSPSGRWAVDVCRKGSGDEGVFAHIFDMLTMSYNRYNSYGLKCLKKVIGQYWVSEYEFVVVDETTEEGTVQVFCHVDHEKRCVIPFMGEYTPLEAAKSLSIRAANPLYYKGKQYYLVVKGINMLMVPWNSFYDNSGTLLITMPRLKLGDHSTYEIAFCQGSKIFMPLKRHFRSEEGKCISHEYAVHGMLVIDLNKVDFNDRRAYMPENWKAMQTIYFKPLNPKQLHTSVAPLKFRQVGEYVMAYTTDRRTNRPNDQLEVKQRTIYVMNLSELTMHCTTITSGPLYFPTIYSGKLFVVRNDPVISEDGKFKWVNEFTMKRLFSNKVSSLLQLAREAQVRHSTPVDPVYTPFIFPEIHLCIPNSECFCNGIVKTSHAEKHQISVIIERTLKSI